MRKRRRKSGYIIGVDEVGRGALAGPVVVAALALPRKFEIRNPKFETPNSRARLATGQANPKFKIQKSKLKLRDSKKLTPKQREIWFRYVKNHTENHTENRTDIFYETASVSPKIVDKINIARAANLAATKAFTRLIANCKSQVGDCRVFLDGGLYLNKSNIKNKKLKTQIKNKKRIKTIIKGDEKIPAIMLASIMAKVTRDRYMKKLHKKYPEYDFINNVGYGTKKHIRAIKRHGHADVHRLTFLKKYVKI